MVMHSFAQYHQFSKGGNQVLSQLKKHFILPLIQKHRWQPWKPHCATLAKPNTIQGCIIKARLATLKFCTSKYLVPTIIMATGTGLTICSLRNDGTHKFAVGVLIIKAEVQHNKSRGGMKNDYILKYKILRYHFYPHNVIVNFDGGF